MLLGTEELYDTDVQIFYCKLFKKMCVCVYIIWFYGTVLRLSIMMSVCVCVCVLLVQFCLSQNDIYLTDLLLNRIFSVSKRIQIGEKIAVSLSSPTWPRFYVCSGRQCTVIITSQSNLCFRYTPPSSVWQDMLLQPTTHSPPHPPLFKQCPMGWIVRCTMEPVTQSLN